MKENTLVIAGIGRVEYALSAAIVVRQLGMDNTKNLCTITADLPKLMTEIAADKKEPPDRIVIMGVGLHKSPDMLLQAVRKLKKRGTAVTWISRVPLQKLPEGVPGEMEAEIEIVCQENVPLYKIAAEKYGCDFSEFAEIDKVADEVKPARKRGATTKARSYAELINACYYQYRNFQDTEPCRRMVRYLAAGDFEEDWSKEDKQIVTKYLRYGHREIGGTSEVINALRKRIKIVAKKNVPRVLITGESGTGKETVAQHVHLQSPRASEPMISFNCASVSPQLLEVRFFGCKKGAYTDAIDQVGLFRRAEGSTLFLDEVGELPLDMQAVLLRVLEEGKFYPVGGGDEVTINDVHIIAATNRDLAKMVAEKQFREDLYYRLNMVELKVPALRDRLEDIKDIANGRWREVANRDLKDEEIRELQQYDYPGNVRELNAILDRAAIFNVSFTDVIKEMRATKLYARPAAEEEPPDNLEEVVRNHVRYVYDKYGGNVAKAARALGKSQNTVRKYLDL